MSSNRASEEEKEVLEKYLFQFLNFERRFPLLPGIQNTEAAANLLGLSEDEFLKLRDRFSTNAKSAATELLEDEEVNVWLDELPFSSDETIVALGDSITGDQQGWFHILQNALEISVPAADFTFINAGLSYNTSTDALKRLNRDVLSHDPDWVFVALGTFDMQRLRVAPERPLVPLAEFWENINVIEQAILEVSDNPIVWITPPPVLTEMLQQIRLFNFDLYEEDLQKVREVLTGRKGFIVDPMGTRMGTDDNEPDAWNYLSDGLHPSLSGHVITVKEIFRHLTQTNDPQQGAQLDKPDDVGD